LLPDPRIAELQNDFQRGDGDPGKPASARHHAPWPDRSLWPQSKRLTWSPADLLEQPQPRQRPIAFGGARGQVEHRADLFE